jgi:hypothetical protein
MNAHDLKADAAPLLDIARRNDRHDRQNAAIEASDAARTMAALYPARFRNAVESCDAMSIGLMFLSMWQLQHLPAVEVEYEPQPRRALSDDELERLNFERNRG